MTESVFVGPIGEPLNPRGAARVPRGAEAGRPAADPLPRPSAQLRQLARSSRGPAKVVQAILGHSSISLTLGTYSHVFAEQHEQAAVAMDGIIGATGPG